MKINKLKNALEQELGKGKKVAGAVTRAKKIANKPKKKPTAEESLIKKTRRRLRELAYGSKTYLKKEKK